MALIIFLVLVFIYHQVQLQREQAYVHPLGEMVQVKDKKMSLAVQGQGDKTLIMLAGGGTTVPILDFKTLGSQLSQHYRVVTVEKFGYGFSDDILGPRDVDTLLEETRMALAKKGIKGPFVLLPHSMSGIQALRWAQKYPEEVEAIVGLDMAMPASYDEMKLNPFFLYLLSFSARGGLIRLLPGVAESDAMQHGKLSDQDKKIYRALFYRRTMNAVMVRELQAIKDSAKDVEAEPLPDVPYLLLVSNGQGTSYPKARWQQFQKDFTQQVPHAQVITYDCPHYLHNYVYLDLAKEIEDFLEEK
ncbi:alpha/beta hydrolase [Vaginisenegalia massiliensis]|uniref:alpha/beta hydrolase n=1 Tax=Vaginisenegalia massiliensis TaxID=2058294 RepID=UPI0013DE5172|nr:alpha/beta hydrolase [Vaginisenegalia massiliensis]